ncbi:MAG: TatD family hydrolase [Candidatus Dormiibacterota bacterium]
MTRLIDTHIHLDDLEGEVTDIVEEAAAAGVTDLIMMGTDGATSRQAVAWSQSLLGVWAAVGHHPLNQEGPDLGELRALAGHPRTVAIGEIGLDLVDEHRGPWEAQEGWFRDCCALAVELDLPVSVHIRGTEAEAEAILRDYPGLRGVMHYWTLDWAWAERYLALGFLLSFSGVVTRATREEVRDVARRVPADRLLLETDAPWGTPRGRSGAMRPAWMVDTARTIAEVRGLSLDELDRLQRANAGRLFTKLRS